MTKLYFRNFRSFVCLMALLSLSFGVQYQAIANETETQIHQSNFDVVGKVVDANGEGIIGARVMVVGTTNATASGLNGLFELKNVSPNSQIEASFFGYETQIVVASSELTITLAESATDIQEVVVVGYGVQKKESLTGSLNIVDAKKLKSETSPTVENMLNGKVPGLFVAPGAGPGAVGKIMIRGKSSVNGGVDPLWVVDGVIIGTSASTLNPADIETMTVLKDAASIAIYGSQGANGVILVTTKSAKSGKLNINVNTKVGVTSLDNGNLQVMNGAQLYDYYASFSNQESIVFPRWNSDLRNSDFSWWDLASTTGVIQEYNVSLSGGTEQLKSYFSANFYDEAGAVKGYEYSKYDVLYKAEYKPLSFLTFRPSINVAMTEVDNRQYSTTAMYSNLPWDSPYDENGDIVGHYSDTWVNSNSTNYLYDLQWNKSASESKNIRASIDFDVNITDWMTFKSVNNYIWGNSTGSSYYDPRSSSGEGVDGRIYQYSVESTRRYTNQMLQFQKSWGDHHVSGLLAYEYNDYRYESLSATGTGFVAGFEILDVTAVPESVGGYISEWATQSYFAKASYSYKYKYMLELVARRDGASNFGTNAKYGNFYSVSGAWNINKESWFDASWVNELKLRASYGSSGNRPSSLYPQYDLYSVSQSYNEVSGALISQIGNEDLTWERSNTFDVGVDFQAFDSRLRVNFDYYNRLTTDLLYAVPVSGVVGVTSIYSNVGEMENNGIELTVGGDIIRNHDWLWSVDVTYGSNTNKVLKLYDGQDQLIIGGGSGIAGGASRLLTPGMDADTWYLPEWAGVDPATGSPLWYKTDTDGSRVTTTNYAEADYVTCGAYTPDFFGGFSTYLSYKQFDLSANFGFSVGGKIYNYSRSEYDSDGAYTDRNQMVLMNGWSRWEEPGDIATHPVATYNNSSNSNKASTRYLEDGSYLKLRSLSLGYTLDLPKSNSVKSIRFALSGENLFTITDYSGVDPEIAPMSGTTIGGEVTTGVYPNTRKFILSIGFTI